MSQTVGDNSRPEYLQSTLVDVSTLRRYRRVVDRRSKHFSGENQSLLKRASDKEHRCKLP